MVHNQEEVVVHSEEVEGMGEALVQQEENSHKIGPAIPVAKVGLSEPAGANLASLEYCIVVVGMESNLERMEGVPDSSWKVSAAKVFWEHRNHLAH